MKRSQCKTFLAIVACMALCAVPEHGVLAATALEEEVEERLVLTQPVFFTKADYRGRAVMLGVGSYTRADLAAQGIPNNAISSLRLFQPGWKIQLFNHGDFTGTSITVTVDTPSLAARGFDNQLSSLRITQVSIPKTGLVAYYPFQGSPRDASGHGLHCRRYGAVLTADRWGQPQNAYRFNGIAAFLECPDTPRLGVQAGVDMTVSVWVRPLARDAGGIISKYRHYPPELCDFYVSIQAPDDSATTVITAQGFDGLFDDAPQQGTWSHLSVVYRGTQGNATLYMHGKAIGTAPLTFNPAPGPLPLLIGIIPGGTPLGVFTGDIDDVRIYERALTAAEIRRLARE